MNIRWSKSKMFVAVLVVAFLLSLVEPAKASDLFPVAVPVAQTTGGGVICRPPEVPACYNDRAGARQCRCVMGSPVGGLLPGQYAVPPARPVRVPRR